MDFNGESFFQGSIKSVDELLSVLKSIRPAERWFRGHRDATWRCTPSVFRDSTYREKEVELLARFRQQAAVEGARHYLDNWGWLTFAQHHGVPTRLLDWSENPLVGMFFAVAQSDSGASSDGALLILDPALLNEGDQKTSDRIPLLIDSDSEMKPYYPGVTPDGLQTRAVLAPMSFDRIRYQTGMFTISTFKPEGVSLDSSAALQRYCIPFEAKNEIRNELDCLGINEASVYRDLDRIARRIKELS